MLILAHEINFFFTLLIMTAPFINIFFSVYWVHGSQVTGLSSVFQGKNRVEKCALTPDKLRRDLEKLQNFRHL